MIVHLYTLCYNEIELLPFAVDYWKTVADKVIVLDNGSDDGTIEYLQKIPCVEVRHFGNGDGFNERTNADVKNNVWKESRGIADFVIVTDFDEFMYARDLRGELQKMQDNGETIVKPIGYQIFFDDFPEYKDGALAHESCKGATLDYMFCKCTIFNPNEIDEMRYGPGAHKCNPQGNVKWYSGDKIFLFHHKYLGFEYTKKRSLLSLKRLSETSIKLGVSVRYSLTDDGINKIFSKLEDNSVDIELLIGKN